MAPGPSEAVDEGDAPAGVVPHYHAGKNALRDEFARRYRVPVEATRGGAETMYPEYQQKVQKMPIPPPMPKKSSSSDK